MCAQRIVNYHGGWELQLADLHYLSEIWRGDHTEKATLIL